jgi:DNA transformation protein|tara:strand:+ start:75 stop:431 length:357 start_codon:yes stop_codon:yes gene_type:complete
MKNKNEFLNYMLDLLEPMGELSYKPLFGGYAICKHDAAFALVFDGTVYFKTDTTNRKDYESYNSNPLTYRKQGKTISLSNLEVPAEVMEDQDRLLQWANTAYKIAKNVKKKNNKSKDK